MSEVAATNSLFNNYSTSASTDEKSNTDDNSSSGELGQTAFLELMITQLENQDPLSPQDNSAFVAQLAQFSSVESLDRLNTNFDSFTNSFMANQALQASSLVGRSVTVPSNQTALSAPNGLVSGSVNIPQSVSDVNLEIYTEEGDLIDQVSLGPHQTGELVFRWNGERVEVNGELLDWESTIDGGAPIGKNYRFEVSSEIDDQNTQLDLALSANVNSVTIGPDGSLTLNLAGIGAVSMADVKQFNEPNY